MVCVSYRPTVPEVRRQAVAPRANQTLSRVLRMRRAQSDSRALQPPDLLDVQC